MTESLTLVAQGASATFLPHRGGLLKSLKLMHGKSARELLWLPDDFTATGSGWPGGGMPLMFPFAGRVFLAGEPFKYAMDGATYAMPLHGFAYGLPWRVAEQSAASCKLTCTHGAGTTALYPYEFSLAARYELTASRLAVHLDVKHDRALPGAPREMPIALGWHPYFRLASPHAEVITAARQEMQVTPVGAAGKAHLADPSPWRASLAEPKTRNLILGDLERGRASLKHGDATIQLTAEPTTTWQQWVLWRNNDAFQCVEPWMGLPDAVNSGAGLKRLAAGERLSVSFEVELA
jgi:galactose mutarotase-like enzyme